MGPSVLEDCLLPESKPPLREFVLSLGAQALAVWALLWVGVLRPHVLLPPTPIRTVIALVSTPPPINHQPAPLRTFRAPDTVAQLEKPLTEQLHLPAAQPKPKTVEAPAPVVNLAAKEIAPLPAPAAVVPKQLVKTNVFSTGSSAVPTIARAPQQVQTGGFGDPNGVPARPTVDQPVNIAQIGSFNLPSGSGYGNGTGGAHGARGVVASAGFGDGVATGDNSGRVSASRGAVHPGGFADVEVPAANTANARPATPTVPRMVPAEILAKPVPAYTEEARKLKIEGEVLIEVVLESSGQLRVVRVLRGLGHGLDESAVRAAEKVRFRPALRDGQPADSTVVLHVIFQMA